MGRLIEQTFVGAYIKLGFKSSDDADIAFARSDAYKKTPISIYFCDYIHSQIDIENYECYYKAICPADEGAQISGEITTEKILKVKQYVEKKYEDLIKDLREITGESNLRVIVGVYEHKFEIA